MDKVSLFCLQRGRYSGFLQTYVYGIQDLSSALEILFERLLAEAPMLEVDQECLQLEQPKWSGFPGADRGSLQGSIASKLHQPWAIFPYRRTLIEGSGSNRFSRGEVNEVHRAMLTVLSRGLIQDNVGNIRSFRRNARLYMNTTSS